MGLSGVQRTVKFVKYLSRFGWEPVVLTVEAVGYYARDASMMEEVEAAGVRVVRTPAAGPGRFLARREVVRLPSERTRKRLSRISDALFIPDNKIGWRRTAVRTALHLHAEAPFDLIFATAPPFTSFLAGMDVKAAIRKPLVLDYRDPWAQYPFRFYPTPFHRRAHRALERRALKASSHVVAANRRVKELLIEDYPFLTYHDIDIITQGYDPADFVGTEPPPAPPAPRPLRIGYAGIFWEDRVPDYFLQALRSVLAERPDLRGKIEAVFIGNFRDENLDLVRSLGLADSVRVMGYLPHRECIRELRGCDALWMISGDDFGSPGKLYEYVGTGRQILGCVPEGHLQATVLEAGGIVTPPRDVGRIAAAIHELYRRHTAGLLQGSSPEVRRRYDRVELTSQLVKVFNSCFEP
jgi:glycosyltransferase involved in cell wall biosynthesis